MSQKISFYFRQMEKSSPFSGVVTTGSKGHMLDVASVMWDNSGATHVAEAAISIVSDSNYNTNSLGQRLILIWRNKNWDKLKENDKEKDEDK